MKWTHAQRRSLLNLWCRVARADGVVVDSELERLSQLFYHLGDGAVSAAELDLWLENGPPELEEALPRAAERVFLKQARTIMRADDEVVAAEAQVVQALLQQYFRK